jgi:hypothetical protein
MVPQRKPRLDLARGKLIEHGEKLVTIHYWVYASGMPNVRSLSGKLLDCRVQSGGFNI